jgi:hypothetical protein
MRHFLASALHRAVVSDKPFSPFMEQPCYKCGQAVEQGVPFCVHCSAPQIRVVMAEGQSEPADRVPVSPRPEPSSKSLDLPNVSTPSAVVNWQHGVPAAALAGGIAGIAMTLVGLFGILTAVAGFLSVVFYRRRTRGSVLAPRAGARLGATSGVMSFLLFSVLTIPSGLFRRMMLEMLKEYSARRSDPQLQATFDGWAEMLKTQQGLTVFLACLFFVIIATSAIGGALGGAFLGRNRKL